MRVILSDQACQPRVLKIRGMRSSLMCNSLACNNLGHGHIASRSGRVDLCRPKSDLPVESLLQKYFRSLLTQITCISLAIPSRTEGRFAIVTDVGHGMRWTRHVKRRMTLRADGKVVWS
jgi:hypothetical protein